MLLVQSDTSPVNRYRHMLVLMCVNSDDNLNGATADVTNISCHLCLPWSVAHWLE